MKILPVAALIAGLAPSLAFAAEITPVEPFAWATTKTQKSGGAFVSVRVDEGEDALVGAASPAAKKVQIHHTIMDEGVMRMREVPAPLPLSPDHPVEMKPGGVHVMLMGLNHPLVAGETVPVTLIFRSGAEVTVDVPVKARK